MPQHETTNPERENFFNDISEVLKHGYVMTAGDVDSMLLAYGYAAGGSSNIMANKIASRLLENSGSELVIGLYRNRRIYYDGMLEPEETDIVQVREEIDSDMAATTQARVSTLLENRLNQTAQIEHSLDSNLVELLTLGNGEEAVAFVTAKTFAAVAGDEGNDRFGEQFARELMRQATSNLGLGRYVKYLRTDPNSMRIRADKFPELVNRIQIGEIPIKNVGPIRKQFLEDYAKKLSSKIDDPTNSPD